MEAMAQYDYEPLKPSKSKDVTKMDSTFSRKCRCLTAGLFIFLAWALSLVLVYQLRPSSPRLVSYTYNDSDDRKFECGTTVSEAQAAGCEFDPVTFAWLPERCLDRELAFELLHNTTWKLHADPFGKIEKSDLEFAANESDTYITHANHVLHCLFSWRRLHRMLLAGKPYHSGMAYRHTFHCSQVILDAFHQPPDQIQNKALVIVPAC